jgi:hypothetical protein
MLVGDKWFSALDLERSYWQVDLHADEKDNIALSMGEGLWQFTVMPSGLFNVPATFERLIESAL